MRINSKLFSSVNTKSVIFSIVILFACAAFIFTGFGSLRFSGLGSMNADTAAVVGSLTIDMPQFANMMSKQGASNLSSSDKKIMASQVINQMIIQKILAEQADKIGWDVNDSEIVTIIKTAPLFQDSKTHTFSLQLFKQFVASQQMSEVDFYNNLKDQLKVQKMQNLLLLPVVYPNQVSQKLYDIQNTEFNLEYAIIAPSDISIKNKIEEKSKTYLQDSSHIKELEDLYESKKDEFHQNAQTRVRTILISYKDATRPQGEALNRSKEDALKLVNEIYAKIKSGADFMILASQTNDDTKAKKELGDLGFVDSSNIDPASVQAIQNLNPSNLISSIIDTPFGYRIFQFEDSKPAINLSFEDAKAQLAQKIVTTQLKNEMQINLQNDVAQTLVARNLTKLADLLSQNQIVWQFVGKPFKVTDEFISGLGNTSNLSKNIFMLSKPGDVGTKLIDFGDKKVAIRLVSIKQPQAPTGQQIDDLIKKTEMYLTQDFAQNAEQNLFNSYEKEGKIKINPAIL